MFVQPGVSYLSILAENSRIKSNSPAVIVKQQRPVNVTPSSNKRRLSGEKEENPSSRIHLSNTFSLLQDDMDHQSLNFFLASPVHQVGHPLSACSPP